ncbi:hypothetical protein ACFX4N_24105 [Priestia sp. YIM B13551]|uniref:hypothetical protein n=1 Tax=Priestia sp. YIM B13551 TaxID=3366306 RepID=UPI00366F9C9B
MLMGSTLKARKTFFIQILAKDHGIEDERFIEFLHAYVDEETTELDYPYILETMELFFEFHFDWVEVPYDVHDEYVNGWNYQIIGAIHIPELMKYINHPKYPTFIEGFDIVQDNVVGDGNLIEFVHLPTSELSNSGEGYIRDFANQPATFIIGIQEETGISLEETVEFLLELKKLNDYIALLAKDERGEIVA